MLKLSQIGNDFQLLVLSIIISLPTWDQQSESRLPKLLHVCRRPAPACPLLPHRLCELDDYLEARVPPNLMPNYSRAYPRSYTCSHPPHNKWRRFAQGRLLLHKRGMFLLKSFEQFPLPKTSCAIPDPFQMLPLGKSQPLPRLLQKTSRHASQPISAFL